MSSETVFEQMRRSLRTADVVTCAGEDAEATSAATSELYDQQEETTEPHVHAISVNSSWWEPPVDKECHFADFLAWKGLHD